MFTILVNYLSDRENIVEIDGVCGTLKSVICGIPQETVLGTMLF